MKIKGQLVIKVPIEVEVAGGTYPEQARMQLAKKADELWYAIFAETSGFGVPNVIYSTE